MSDKASIQYIPYLELHRVKNVLVSTYLGILMVKTSLETAGSGDQYLVGGALCCR